MRDIVCAVCGSADRTRIYASTAERARSGDGRVDPYGGHYQINRCRRCGLRYSNPIFDADQVQELYTESPHGNIVGGEEQNVERTMQGYYALARPALSGRERMLDIGCDVGLLLDAGRRDGFNELYGIEPVGVAAAQAAALPGARISTRFYEEEDFPDEHFDLITLVHVVDHLVDPIVTLERAWAQLKPGGVILAVVHDGGSLLARVLGERFPPYNLYHHYFFERRDLRRLFRRAHFEVLRTMLTYNCYSFGFLVQKVPGLPLREQARRGLDAVGIGKLPITLPLGNIGIVARRPFATESTAERRAVSVSGSS